MFQLETVPSLGRRSEFLLGLNPKFDLGQVTQAVPFGGIYRSGFPLYVGLLGGVEVGNALPTDNLYEVFEKAI